MSSVTKEEGEDAAELTSQQALGGTAISLAVEDGEAGWAARVQRRSAEAGKAVLGGGAQGRRDPGAVRTHSGACGSLLKSSGRL